MIQAIVLVYVGLLAVLYVVQARMIFPGSQVQGTPEAQFTPPEGAELVRLKTPSGETVAALYGAALDDSGHEPAPSRQAPSLIYFYGNGMCLRDTLDQFTEFRRMGLNVIIPDYVGYGLSSGRPSEAGCYEAAEAAYDHLVHRPDVDPGRVIAAGWSLGGAVAIELAHRHHVAGVAAFSTFTSMADMGRRQCPFLPVSLLLRHRFESERKLREIRCPVLIGHSRNDSLVPFDMADRLAAAAAGPVSRVTIAGADHGEFFAVGAGKIYPALGQFLEGLSRPGE